MSKNLAADILHQTAPSRWADSQSTLLNKASPLPVLLRAHAAKAREEFAEGRGVGKVKVVGYLCDAQPRGLQQERGLHK